MNQQTANPASEILKARARALAKKPSDGSADGATIDVIEFRLAKERYAIERQYVREVSPLKELTAVPCTPPFIAGIVNIRGQIIPVIDIKKFFELPETGITDLHMIVIVHVQDIEVGILADAVVGARSSPLSALQASLPTLTGIRAQFLRGVSDEQVVIVDAHKLLTEEKIFVNDNVDT